MVAANLKAETMALMEERDAIEGEMNSIISRLCQPGGPGISGNLVDSEAYIDIPVVRADRHRLSELHNDYEDITGKISKSLQIMHSTRLAPNVSAGPKSSDNQVQYLANTVTPATSHGVLPKDSPGVVSMDSIVITPFAIVDEIADASPAAEDGLQLGDQIVKFGNVESGDNLLRRLASEAQSNQGREVPLMVLRQGTVINFNVTPRPWHGRGLLGCHFRIL
ncbi:PDZ domain [Macleaya cordata]|uniref:PDZ domain n=1 Tax=Macleaya cordata TaxID=56857 RepID=A0A200R1F5_MACCD|nr:PDZ domain [Macleaya cordata]